MSSATRANPAGSDSDANWAKNAVELLPVLANGAFDVADFAVDDRGVPDQVALEFLASGPDAPLRLHLDPDRLLLRPRMDAVDVFLGEAAQLRRFAGRTGADLLDVCFGGRIDLSGDPLALALGRATHGIGELGQESSRRIGPAVGRGGLGRGPRRSLGPGFARGFGRGDRLLFDGDGRVGRLVGDVKLGAVHWYTPSERQKYYRPSSRVTAGGALAVQAGTTRNRRTLPYSR